MDVYFTDDGWKDYCHWHKYNKRIIKRINLLIEDIKIRPFSGIGKPEPLQYELSGSWSRRIDKEHRLTYCIKNKEIWVFSCRGHYRKRN